MATDRGHGVGVVLGDSERCFDCRSSLFEQRNRGIAADRVEVVQRLRRGFERSDLDGGLWRDVEAFPAGGHHPHLWCGVDDPLRQLRGAFGDLFTVVQHQQHAAGPQRGFDGRCRVTGVALDPQRGDHGVADPVVVRYRRQVGDEHPVAIVVRRTAGHFQRHRGLAHPTNPGQRHQPAGAQQVDDMSHFPIPAEDHTRRCRNPGLSIDGRF